MGANKPSKQEIRQEIAELQTRIDFLQKQLRDEDISADLSLSLNFSSEIEHFAALDLQKLVDTASIGILLVDRDSKIIFANEVSSVMFGYERHELVGSLVHRLVPERFRDRHVQHLLHFFSNPKPRPMGGGLEILAQHRDGTEFLTEISLNTLESESGLLTVAFISDISEIKQGHLSYKKIIDADFIGIIVVNTDGRIMSANDLVAKLFGYEKQQLWGVPVNQLVPKHLGDAHTRHLERFFANPQPRPMGKNIDLMGKKQDGTLFPVEISLSAIQSESVTLCVAFISDITERKKTEEQFKNLIDTAAVGIIVVEQDGSIVLANQIVANLYQYTRHELSNMSIDWLIPENARKRHSEHIKNYFANPQPRLMGNGLELRCKKRDGTQFYVEISLSTVQSTTGTLGVAFIADITERKKSEALRARIKEKLITDFGHDFKTPMSSIITRLHILQRALDKDLHRHTDLLAQQIQHLDRLLESVLTMARLDIVETIDLGRANLNHLIIRVVEANNATAQMRNINLHYDLDESPCYVQFNEKHLFDALGQLVKNALSYTLDGGDILLTIHEDEDYVNVSVSDTGIGIPEDKLPFIFERFYRVDDSRQSSDSLNGIGLAMVKRIVKLHQGEITATSKLGEGSTFQITLQK